MMKGNLRWAVVGLVALATVINYIDRGAMGILWPDIKAEFGFSNQDYANIFGVFVLAYALGQTIFGKIFDWLGTRIGFVLSIGVWSFATMLHAFGSSVLSFQIFRSILGVAEAGNWPGASKANAEWFPVKERALAQGIFNSGAAIGGILSPLVIAGLSVFLGWKAIFVVIGLIGFLWLIPWMIVYKAKPEDHPWLDPKEREYILSGQLIKTDDGVHETDYNPSTGEMLSRKETWGAILPAMFIDPIWWLFVAWIPIYLIDSFGFNVKELGLYAWVPYVGAMFGAWFSGLLAQSLLGKGWTVNKTRKFVITLGAAIMIPALLAMAITGHVNVLAIFGIDPSVTTLFQNADVKTMLFDPVVQDMMKTPDVVQQLAGLDTAAIMADPNVTTMLANPELKNTFTSETLSALSSYEDIQGAKTVAATLSVITMAIILFGFQTSISNVQTLPSDLYNNKAVGSLAGYAGTAAKLAAAALVWFVPTITNAEKFNAFIEKFNLGFLSPMTENSYMPAFLIGVALAVLAVLSIFILIPKIEPLKPKGYVAKS